MQNRLEQSWRCAKTYKNIPHETNLATTARSTTAARKTRAKTRRVAHQSSTAKGTANATAGEINQARAQASPTRVNEPAAMPMPGLGGVDFIASMMKPLAAEMPQGGALEQLAQGLEHLPYRLDPQRVVSLQRDYADQLARLWVSAADGQPRTATGDKRFDAPEWDGMHAYLAQVYLLNARFMTGLADSIEASEHDKAKVRFAVQQWVDALAPSNFLATNPEVQKKFLDSRGESLSAGMANMLADLQKGRISQTDESAFEVGRNVGTSVGTVVFENEIFQLIQYRPLTDNVFERPLLIVPPCINKYYILDLQPENSFVRHAVNEGHTVYLMSWRNPMQQQAHLTWDDYIEEGTIRAVHVVEEISSRKRINILGFCVGGTMISTALAVLAGRGEHPAKSLTLLTTLLDFSDTGILDVFVDEAMLQMREHSIGGIWPDGKSGGPVGLLPARDLATSFSFLRPNDLVWNYVVNNYLKGESPAPFDLLYWNADSTNLPGPFYVWYLRNTYLENNLRYPGKVKVCGVPVDFGLIDAPVFIYGSREDHIVPWHAAYANIRLFKGPVRFVLGASGHIAGVINPPAKGKRNYWSYTPLRGKFPEDPEAWFNSAAQITGSWWPEWSHWLASHAGKRTKAPAHPGNADYEAIEPAPGRYVRVRAV
jgi:polyhydroxyalkanoate synthase subunit PhaC